MAMRIVAGFVIASVGTAARVLAHLVPIPASTCAFAPMALSVPAMGLVGAAQPAGPADAMRIVYDAAANQIQVCPAALAGADPCGDPVARPFTLGTMAGTMTFPAVFNGGMLSSGDVTIPDLPITIAIGGTTASVPVTLTTALVALNGAVVEGVPLQALGSLELVGVIDGSALPPPLAGRSALVTVSCLPRPVPDKDQFAPPIETISLGGRIASGKARIRAMAAVSLTSPPDLASGPTLLSIDVDGTMVAAAVVSAGMHGSGRTITGTSDDGRSAIMVRSVRRGATSRLTMTAQFSDVTLPPQTPGAPVLVDLTLDAGGVIWRGEQLFHVSHDGRTLRSG
jgi:hypothetical protein